MKNGAICNNLLKLDFKTIAEKKVTDVDLVEQNIFASILKWQDDLS